MKHLYELIEKRSNFEPCNFFIDKFNVKKFCEKFDIIYGELPSIRISDSCGERFIGTLYHDTVTILHVELGDLYSRDKFHLKNLLKKKFFNDCAVVIITNNKNVSFDTSITDEVINYKVNKTGLFWIDFKNFIKMILHGSN